MAVRHWAPFPCLSLALVITSHLPTTGRDLFSPLFLCCEGLKAGRSHRKTKKPLPPTPEEDTVRTSEHEFAPKCLKRSLQNFTDQSLTLEGDVKVEPKGA